MKIYTHLAAEKQLIFSKKTQIALFVVILQRSVAPLQRIMRNRLPVDVAEPLIIAGLPEDFTVGLMKWLEDRQAVMSRALNAVPKI